MYSKTLNDYIPAHVVFDHMINSCPELVKYFNSQEKLMTSTNPYSDIKWNDIVPWVTPNIFQPKKMDYYVDINTNGVHIPSLITHNTATEQIANKVVEDNITLGNKMYSAPIVKDSMLQKCNSDYNGGEEVTEENYFIKVEYALKENNPFGATSAKEMFTLEAITTMQIDAILLSNYIEYTKTHNEKIVKIKDGSIQSRLDNTPHQLYVHIDTQEMYVQNGEFSFLPAVPFFAEKEEKIMDKQDEDEIDQYNIECEQGEHEIHFAMDNNLLPERWDARDYHFNLAQVAANVATADALYESRRINLSKQFKDYFQRFTSDQVKQTTINNIMTGM